MPVVCDELLNATHTLTQDDIERAKTQLKAGVLMKRESTSARAEGNARDMAIYGRIIDKDETLAKVDAVSKEQLEKLALSIFTSKPTLASLGPVKHVLSYDKLQERLKV